MDSAPRRIAPRDVAFTLDAVAQWLGDDPLRVALRDALARVVDQAGNSQARLEITDVLTQAMRAAAERQASKP